MIKLILSDMDGTFLNREGDFNRPLFKELKQLLKETGVVFAPCTGKQCERIEELFGPEDAKDFWILGDSATRIKHNGEYVYQSLLPNELGLRIIKKLEEISKEYTIIACTPTAAIVKKSISDDELKIVKGSYAKVIQVDDLNEIKEDFVKITIYDKKLQCFKTREKLAEFFDSAYIVASEAAWIDISNLNVHKGTTVEKLQEMLAIDFEETMVFGDGLNDVELMERGAFSFAMRDGFEETKEAANYIIRTNEDDSVMKTIIQILSLQKK
ncbi:HAD-IIB family hydrolase [Enterococcus larvae]|uniref:HAD-IIB family hydrolase n=1 Tax=Enterococcus larvae TaxID=2794352 RepID=UPI003F35DF96